MSFDSKFVNDWTSRKDKGSSFYVPSSTQSNVSTDLVNFRRLLGSSPNEESKEPTYDSQQETLKNAYAAKSVKPTDTSSMSQYDLDDLENDEVFQDVAARFLKSMDEDDDIFEYLRDSDYRVSTALYRGATSGKWSEQQKADYAYLRSTFDNADVGSFSNMVKATADGVIDFVTDPIHLLSVMLTPLAGAGVAAAGARIGSTKLASNFAQSKALRSGIKKLRDSNSVNGINYAITEGMVQGTGSSVGNQNIEVNTNLRNSFSAGEAGLSGLIGGTAGGVLGLGGAASIIGLRNSKSIQRVRERMEAKKEPKDIDPEERSQTSKEWEKVQESIKNISVIPKTASDGATKFVQYLTGKATAPLVKYVKNSENMGKFLTAIRYDALRDFTGDVTEKAQISFGLALGTRTAKYRQTLQKIFADTNIERTGWTNHITAVQNEQLSFLLNQPQLLNKIGIKEIKDEAGAVVSYEFKGNIDQIVKQLDDAWRSSRNLDIETTQDTPLKKLFGEANVDRKATNINKDTVMAALRLKKLTNDVYQDATGIQSVDGSEVFSLFEEGQKVTDYFPRYYNLQAIKDRTDDFEKLIYNSDHSKLNDEYITIKVRDPDDLDVVETKVEVKKLKSDQAYFKNFFDKYGGKATTFKEVIELEAKKAGKTLTPEQIEIDARALKSKRLVKDMLDREFPALQFTDEVTNKPLRQQRTRAFYLLEDQDLIDNGFIENNVEQIYVNYFDDMAGAIERKRYLGVTLNEFQDRYSKNVRQDLLDAGLEPDEVNDAVKMMKDTYESVTGTKARNPQLLGEKFVGVQNFIKLTQQLAHLPLATISSLTEPLIVLTKVDVQDVPEVYKAFGTAAGKQMKKSFSRFFTRMDGALKKAGFSDRKVKGFKDLTDDEWAEAYTFSIATEYSAQQRLSSMYAGAVQGKVTGAISEAFFKATLLAPWTQAVQFGAFKSAKGVIKRLTKNLAEGNLSAAEKQRAITKLWQIGVSPKKAVDNYKKYSVNGVLDDAAYSNSAFYQNDVLSSSNLFAREVILNPAASEANKPLWFNSPVGQLVMQFASYPTVFNNTVLKNMAREVSSDPVRNAPKLVAATALMTGGAVLTNAFRSEGRSLEEEETKIVSDAISRWGGFGPLDYGFRYARGIEYGGLTAGSTLKAPFGPLVADVVDAVQFRHSPLQIATQNIPFYSALPKEQRDALKQWARGTKADKPKSTAPVIDNRRFAKGGRVNVPNAVEEPEERKMRGLPFTYSDMGGPSVQDKEDRMGFAEGGEAEVLNNNDYAISVLTKNDDYGHFLEDVDPIATYEASEMPEGTSKESYFVGLQTPNYHEINKQVENFIGMDVSKFSVNIKGANKLEGKLKLSNTLEVDSPVAEVIYEKLKEVKTMPKDVDIIKDIKFELDARDYALSSEGKSKQATELISKSKSVVIKDGLFNLGYDSISYNNGKNVVLLKTNQFIPTKIEKNIIRKKVYGGGLSRTLRRRYDIGGTVEAILGIFAKIPLTKKFLDIQHSRMGIEETDKETFAENMVRFADEIADVETKNNPKEISSADAKGLHQFKDETVKTVVNNFISGRIPVGRDIIDAVRAASKKDPRDWNRDESNLMVLGHMFLTSEQKTYNDKTMSTDPLLRIIGTAKEQDDSYKQAAEFLYMKFHWRGSETSPEYDQALKNIQNRYNNMSFIYGLNNRERSFAAVTERPENLRPIGVSPMPEDRGFISRVKEIFEGYVDEDRKTSSYMNPIYDSNLDEEITKPNIPFVPPVYTADEYAGKEAQDAYIAEETKKLREFTGSYPSQYKIEDIEETKIPTVPELPVTPYITPEPTIPNWKGGMRKHSRTSDYREDE